MTAPLARQLRASLIADSAAIEFRAAVAYRATEMNALVRDLDFMLASGATPGEGTIETLETIGSKILGLALAWAVARGIA